MESSVSHFSRGIPLVLLFFPEKSDLVAAATRSVGYNHSFLLAASPAN